MQDKDIDQLNQYFADILQELEGKISDANFLYIQENIFNYNETVLAYEDIIWLIIDHKIKVSQHVLDNIEKISELDESFKAVYEEEKETLIRKAT